MTDHPHLGSVRGTLWRGGTSKGLFIDETVLPDAPDVRDALVLELFGSPDPLQLNGIGGGISHTSKLVAVAPDDTHDLRYTFGQVGVEEAAVDWSKNSGNIASAVGAYALHEGLIEARTETTTLTLRNTNTGTIIDQQVPLVDGFPAVRGDTTIDGVPGTGAKIATTYRDPGGAVTGQLLPTGSPMDVLEIDGGLSVSVVDCGSLLMFVRAADLGLKGTEQPATLAERAAVMKQLERARELLRKRLELSDAKRSNPAIGIVSQPQPFECSDGRTVAAADIDLTARFISLQPHHAISMTGAMSLAAGSRIAGTIPAEVADVEPQGEVSIGHPKGTVTIGIEVTSHSDGPAVRSATYYRTACPLARGEIYYRRDRVLSNN
ncbi:MAG: PrpF domain-containing protein [Salinirussus sp.]